MGREHEPETVWQAQELYCVDRLSFDAVSERTGVAASTLKRWSEKYGWREKREQIAMAESDIRANFVLGRSSMLQKLLDAQDAQSAFAVASLEKLAMEQAKAAREGGTAHEINPGKPIETMADAAEALHQAVQQKLALLLSDPGQVDFKAVQDIRKAMELVQAMTPVEESGQAAKAKGLTPERAEEFRKQILGIS